MEVLVNEGPTDDEIWDQAQALFGDPTATWPPMRPEQALLAIHVAYRRGLVSQLDFYATATAITILLVSAPSDDTDWPDRTPREFALVGLPMIRSIWGKVIENVREQARGTAN